MAALTVRQAAEKLAVAPATIYALCAARRLKHRRIGLGRGTIRIDEQALEEFMTGATVLAQEPATAKSRTAGEPSTSEAADRQFRHVQWSRLPDSPPGEGGHF